MFGQPKQPPLKSLIAAGTVIEGHIRFSEGLRVDGHVKGDLMAASDAPSLLCISELAVVAGRVSADHIIISGTVQGPVHASKLLELQPKAKVEGDVHYKAIEMHQGAVISGQLRPVFNESLTPNGNDGATVSERAGDGS